jgi:hypothetical protein
VGVYSGFRIKSPPVPNRVSTGVLGTTKATVTESPVALADDESHDDNVPGFSWLFHDPTYTNQGFIYRPVDFL